MDGVTVSVWGDGDQRRAVKVATTPIAIASLQREAEVLRRAIHPGVVAVLAFEADRDQARLTMTAPGGRTLASSPPTTADECMRIVAQVAGVVAELHAIGIAHGAIVPRHILIADDGRPVLCGFSDARAALDPSLCQADVADLGRLVEHLVTITGERMPRVAERAVAASRATGTTARDIAALLSQTTTSAPLKAGRPATLALLALGGVGVLVGVLSTSDQPSTPVGLSSTTATTALAAGDAPVIEVDGVTYRVGAPGDAAFVTNCGGRTDVFVLRPSTGDLFVFDAAGDDLRAVPSIGRIKGATEVLHVDGDPCNQIGVVVDDSLTKLTLPTTRAQR